ncbi:hypothetical protein P175DRAFT_0497309 [Aspergillus ochraceoroseus IBT 24754]|uniref:Uncharacterized protein n=2 Tax=Aspergillus ochraceoroseus TaxID=138278 RepID=A0A2T5M6N3_9EURO|nr:uncharacterized protein P175DRAFT_0497309 [Aspergillus ochraceoroseus IBT 24754]KKK13537.1 hypothetical protein AOCH_007421 [Aspergillus ochraceoroseus]PTU24197.1 hypothetical protein P175DRAFT_0497309 [Aspergillus ochraceoroseus IBT 24754]
MAHSLPTPFTPDSEFAALETPRGGSGSLSITALARFEFEAGKGNDGTKILMIEWEDDDELSRSSLQPGGSWHVEWEGKKAVLPADEKTSKNTRRLYFLLPPHVTIPPVISLSYLPPASSSSSSSSSSSAPTTNPTDKPNAIQLNPLPAIFPPELGADGRSAGKKGVLHTIWAKKRLQVLDKEIHEESLTNVEGIAFHMALQEKEWIESNFGIGPGADALKQSIQTQDPQYPMGPTTPVSPSGGGKLVEKLKGLRLQTGERELAAKGEGLNHLLSPQSPDVAVSSFTSFHNIRPPPPPPPPQPSNLRESQAADTVKTVAHYPPRSIQAQQTTGFNTGFASMGSTTHNSNSEAGEDLFAKALSPRSPDLPRSPFSFSPETLHM